ncbi:amidohydrolase family protein [bacterium]|nr:amidohydrolase family protein [candidate division CSSED10-310 bacterium]
MIVEGNIVTSGDVYKGQLEFDPRYGLITRVGTDLGKADLLVEGFVFPGFIDRHVHAREYPAPTLIGPKEQLERDAQFTKEDFESVGRAAINGGVTYIVEMPNNPYPPETKSAYYNKRRLTRKCGVPVLLFGLITDNNRPFGHFPYKMYLDYPGTRHNFADDNEIDLALKRFRGTAVTFHCENAAILEANAHRKGAAARPPEAEIRAIDQVLEWTGRYRLRTHIAHLSTRRGHELIEAYNQGKGENERVTCEVTPHHLAFSLDVAGIFEEDVALRKFPLWRLLTMKPPLRGEEDRQYLLARFKEGAIDCLATDHAPHTLADKKAGALGVPGLDSFGLFVNWLMTRHEVTPQIIARTCAENPGRFVNEFIGHKRGRLEPGYTSSFTLLDPHGTGARRNFSKCSWTPYPNGILPGAVVETIVDGALKRSALYSGAEPG